MIPAIDELRKEITKIIARLKKLEAAVYNEKPAQRPETPTPKKTVKKLGRRTKRAG